MNTTICFKYIKIGSLLFWNISQQCRKQSRWAGEQDSAGVLKDMNSWTMVLETSMPLEEDQEE